MGTSFAHSFRNRRNDLEGKEFFHGCFQQEREPQPAPGNGRSTPFGEARGNPPRPDVARTPALEEGGGTPPRLPRGEGASPASRAGPGSPGGVSSHAGPASPDRGGRAQFPAGGGANRRGGGRRLRCPTAGRGFAADPRRL